MIPGVGSRPLVMYTKTSEWTIMRAGEALCHEQSKQAEADLQYSSVLSKRLMLGRDTPSFILLMDIIITL